MLSGKVHSIETMGLVDGPGIRTVIFMQGCSLRCSYCHNPDTWSCCSKEEYTPEKLFDIISRYKPFYKTSGGGVTLSGGDPLLQKDFITAFLKLCHESGIHTALDTSGFGIGGYDEILEYTDLVILDIKHIDEKEHIKLTGQGRQGFLDFLEAVKKSKKTLWLRHVVVPGITDSRTHILKLADYINTIPNVQKVELLPYHTFGAGKYKQMGIEYKLDGIPPMDMTKLGELNTILRKKLLHGSRLSVQNNVKAAKEQY